MIRVRPSTFALLQQLKSQVRVGRVPHPTRFREHYRSFRLRQGAIVLQKDCLAAKTEIVRPVFHSLHVPADLLFGAITKELNLTPELDCSAVLCGDVLSFPSLNQVQPIFPDISRTAQTANLSVSSPLFPCAAILPTATVWLHRQASGFEVKKALPLSAAVLVVNRVDALQIKIAVHCYTFPRDREDRGNVRFSMPTTRPKAPLPRVETLPAPGQLKASSLLDRLRWILTPPINQLVSDLTIPETPYGFQLQGIHWLISTQNGLLADEMGLGKTMQAILAARLLWRQRRVENILVICPKSLIGNWKREIKTWWPEIADHVREAESDKLWFLQQIGPSFPIKLINFEALGRDIIRDPLIKNPIQHDLVIIDEAQRIKTPSSKTSIAVKCLRGKRCWALTGTPLENRIEDLISIMQFVQPDTVRGVDPSAIPRVVRPYILRRRLDDPNIGMQLPARIDQDIEIELTGAQRRTYEVTERDRVMQLNAQGDTVTVQHVFQLIRLLVQICNFDPASGESAKMDRLVGDFDEVAESQKKALVFSQFVSDDFGLKRVARNLESHAHRVMALHGEVSPRNREAVIDRFNGSPVERALLVNYTVGAVGLNLQSAAYVFLFDRWWNPAVEDQAIKRAHRYGQKDRVIVRRFYCKDTIEERIVSALRRKRRLFRELIDDERPHEAMGFSEEELFSLFDLKVRPQRVSTTSRLLQLRLASLQPYDFESLVVDLYRKQGFHVDHTGGSCDGGIDLMAERKTVSGVERVVVQCKHVSSPVGPEVLRSHWGVVNTDPSYTTGVLVTSSLFTTDAQTFARGKRLDLIDRHKLIELLRQFGVAEIID